VNHWRHMEMWCNSMMWWGDRGRSPCRVRCMGYGLMSMPNAALMTNCTSTAFTCPSPMMSALSTCLITIHRRAVGGMPAAPNGWAVLLVFNALCGDSETFARNLVETIKFFPAERDWGSGYESTVVARRLFQCIEGPVLALPGFNCAWSGVATGPH